MLFAGRFLNYLGLGLLALAFLLPVISGKSRHEFLASDFADQMPFWTVFALGLVLALLGRKAAERIGRHLPVQQAPDKSVKEAYFEAHAAEWEQAEAEVQERRTVSETPTERQRDLTPGRARLEVMVPPRPSDSWIGGTPSLPDDVAWPEIDGKPAGFVAQICLADLPSAIWDKLGPRDGWLVFFKDLGGSDAARVLHTHRLGEVREMPFGLSFEAFDDARDTRLITEMHGDAALRPQRWPLRILREDDAPSYQENAVITDEWMGLPEGFDMAKPGWALFDWEITRALLEKCREVIELTLDPPEYLRIMRERKGGDRTEILALAQAARGTVEEIAEVVADVSSQNPFDADIGKAISDALWSIEWGYINYVDGVPQGTVKIPMLSAVAMKDFYRTFELRAREVYAADPEALPMATRAELEPMWRAQARAEPCFMGGAVRKAFTREGISDTGVLLDIPSSALIGWVFGDGARWGAFLDGDALKVGAFELAEGVETTA